jgi:hypothetical protein
LCYVWLQVVVAGRGTGTGTSGVSGSFASSSPPASPAHSVRSMHSNESSMLLGKEEDEGVKGVEGEEGGRAHIKSRMMKEQGLTARPYPLSSFTGYLHAMPHAYIPTTMRLPCIFSWRCFAWHRRSQREFRLGLDAGSARPSRAQHLLHGFREAAATPIHSLSQRRGRAAGHRYSWRGGTDVSACL